jgi:uracil-DNA glycosylase
MSENCPTLFHGGPLTVIPQLAERPGGILFLADAPNEESEIKGVPLVGSEGFLLSRALRMANLTDPSQPPQDFASEQRGETRRLLWERRAHSFAYVLPEALPRNADLKVAQARADDGALGYLDAIFDAVKPNVVVTLGDLSLWAVTGEISTEQWRGAPRHGHGAYKIFPTYPLDRVQQSYKLFGPLVADLMKVAHEAQFPEVRSCEVALWLEPDLGDLATFQREHIATSDLLSLDIETAVDQVVCVQVGTDARTALVLPFVDYRKPSRSYWATEAEELAAWYWLRDVLELPVPKLGQNFANYDAIWLLEKMGLTVRNYRHDLRLMHHILQPELPKSLAFMASLYTKMNRWKTNVHHYGVDSSAKAKRDA